MKKILTLPLFLLLVLLYVIFRYMVLVPVCAIYARMRGVMEWVDEFDLYLSERLRDCWRRL